MSYPSKRDKILALALRDSTIKTLLYTAQGNGQDYTETLEDLVLQLAAEKSRLSEHLQAAISSSFAPRPMLLPHGATLLPVPDIDSEAMVSMPKLEKGSIVSLNAFGTASGRYKVTDTKGDTISMELTDE